MDKLSTKPEGDTDEGSPSGEGSPVVDYPEDTDVVEKSFVNEKLVSPKYIPFKGIEDVYKRYKNDLGKADFQIFEKYSIEWEPLKYKKDAQSQVKRDKIRSDARLHYKATLFDLRK